MSNSLSSKKIQTHLNDHTIKLIEVFDEIDSTNTYLLNQLNDSSKIPRVCLAEQQTQGRGRRGKTWHSPAYDNIYLSLLYQFHPNKTDLNGLSLIVAIAIAKALEKLSIKNIQLKWPNDIFINQKKCAGILIETQGKIQNGAKVVIGVGVNVNMKMADNISQPWTSLSAELHQSIDRNSLAAEIIHQLLLYLSEFDQSGFAAFQSEFEQYDLTKNQEIEVRYENKTLTGKSKGVDSQGRLMLENKDGTQLVSIGDVSIKKI